MSYKLKILKSSNGFRSLTPRKPFSRMGNYLSSTVMRRTYSTTRRNRANRADDTLREDSKTGAHVSEVIHEEQEESGGGAGEPRSPIDFGHVVDMVLTRPVTSLKSETGLDEIELEEENCEFDSFLNAAKSMR